VFDSEGHLFTGRHFLDSKMFRPSLLLIYLADRRPSGLQHFASYGKRYHARIKEVLPTMGK